MDFVRRVAPWVAIADDRQIWWTESRSAGCSWTGNATSATFSGITSAPAFDLLAELRRCLEALVAHRGSQIAEDRAAIKAAIAGVNEFIASTAAAVEEQSIVTADMSANMQRASAELA